MFIKHSNGKITSVIESDEELDEQQKKAFKNVAKDITPSKEKTNTKKLES
jgi:hypothetical protein